MTESRAEMKGLREPVSPSTSSLPDSEDAGENKSEKEFATGSLDEATTVVSSNGTKLALVNILGSDQLYPCVGDLVSKRLLGSLERETSNIRLMDWSQSSKPEITLRNIAERIQSWNLGGRCRIKPGDLVALRLENPVDDLVSQLAIILLGGVLLPLSHVDIETASRVISECRPAYLISTRRGLILCDYVLQEVSCIAVAIGGEGELRPQAIDLTAKSPISPPPLSYYQSSLDDPFMLFYDEITKRLWEVNQRNASALVNLNIKIESPFWRERILSSASPLNMLVEILPRFVAEPSVRTGDISEEILTEGSILTLVFDTVLRAKTRRRRQILTPASRVSTAPTSTEASPISQLGWLYVLSSNRKANPSKSLSLRVGVRPTKSENSVLFANAKGSYCVSGPAMLSRAMGHVSLINEYYFLDRDFQLWLDLETPVSLDPSGNLLIAESDTSSSNAIRRVPRPPARPVKPQTEEPIPSKL